MTARPARRNADEPTLVDLLDRTITTGAALSGDVVLSVADVDLVHLGLRLVLRGLDGPLDGPTTSGRLADLRPTDARVGAPTRPDPATDASPADRGRRPPSSPAPPPADDLTSGLARLVEGGASGDLEPRDVQRGLAALVLTLVEVLRELMERQSIRRMENGTIDDDEVERLGRTFLALRERMDELKDVFGLTDEDLNLDLGPLGGLR